VYLFSPKSMKISHDLGSTDAPEISPVLKAPSISEEFRKAVGMAGLEGSDPALSRQTNLAVARFAANSPSYIV
jgi:hypothetical protein